MIRPTALPQVVRWSAVVLLLLLSACQTALTPEQVTQAFWQAMTDGDLVAAKSHTLKDSQHLLTRQQNLLDASLAIGKASIDGDHATVATVLTLQQPENGKVLNFDTVLAKENERWKVDYQFTLNNLSSQPFGQLFESLKGIGEAINKELEQQVPLFEKQLKSFSEELIKQLEDFRKQLEKNLPPDKKSPHSGTI